MVKLVLTSSSCTEDKIEIQRVEITQSDSSRPREDWNGAIFSQVISYQKSHAYDIYKLIGKKRWTHTNPIYNFQTM